MFRKMILNYNSSSSQQEVVNTDHLVISHDDLFVQNPLVQRNKINKIIEKQNKTYIMRQSL